MEIPPSQRLQMIIQLLEDTGYVKAKDLAERFGVSMETIRKDLTFLETEGIARKEYGGASLSLLGVEKRLEYRTDRQDTKKEIARLAVRHLKEYHSLILDTGSTCLACVPYINRVPSMDIITNSVAAFEQLDGERHHVFLCGGKKREFSQSLVGSWTEQYLNSVHADVCFLGTSGILESCGPTTHSYQELGAKRAMMERSDFVFVLADNSKFLEHGFHTVCGWDAVDAIITDHRLSSGLYEQYCKQVPVYVAKEEEDETDRSGHAVL